MLLALALAACQAPDLPPNPDHVDRAIQRGSEWLMNQTYPRACSFNAELNITYDALVLYTLVHARVKKDDRRYAALVPQVYKTPVVRTYTAATVAMALGAHDATQYRDRIFQCAQFLADNQCQNGQWGYGEPYTIPTFDAKATAGGTAARMRIKRSSQAPALQATGDNSNSQYAAMGVHACWKAGVDFDRSLLDRAVAWWERTQDGDGSWGYAHKDSPDTKSGFGSMTVGGGSSVIFLRLAKGDSVKSGAARKAIDWVGANFSVSEHPKSPEKCKRWHFYYLYGMERLGDLFPADKMGKHLWYNEGANWLLKSQRPDGSWGTGDNLDVANTCFAILFLHRATRVASVAEKK